MAEKPKLMPEQWAEVRKTWESDSRKGFPWLIKEMGLSVSLEAVRQRSKAESWKKVKNASLDNEKTKLEKSANNKSKTQVSKVVKSDSKSITKSLIEGNSDNAKANKGGRPTKYRDEYADQAYKLCLIGYTDKLLADFFGVAESTINEWKLDHHEFSESLRRGKDIADAEVAYSLYKAGCGYRYTETKLRTFVGEDGDRNVVEETVQEKELPPNVSAAIVWLKNRQAKYWRENGGGDGEFSLDPDKLKELEERFLNTMEEARTHQEEVYKRRSILIDEVTGRPIIG